MATEHFRRHRLVLASLVLWLVSMIWGSPADAAGPLVIAIGRNDLAAVQAALAAGESPNTPNGQTTALCLASQGGNLAIVTVLIEKGAEVNGRCALSNAPGLTPLMLADGKNRIDIARFLIEKGAEVNAKAGNDFTPLFFAAGISRDSLEFVKLLLAHGADVNVVAGGGRTAILQAVGMEQPDVLKELIDHGADVNQRGYLGTTPLIAAAQKTPSKAVLMVRMLLAKGADPNATMDNGLTVLDGTPCPQGNTSASPVRQALIQAGAKPSGRAPACL